MAPINAFLTFFIGTYISEALVSPLQPKKQAYRQELDLPKVSEINNASQRVLSDLSMQLSSLQNRLNQLSSAGTDSLQKQKAAFEQTLMNQARENSDLRHQNADIYTAIQQHRSSGAKWRGEAEKLAQSCFKLKEDLHLLQANMTLAQEFAQNTLNVTASMLSAPELRVLEELSQEDELKAKDEMHRSHLMDIGEGEDKLALFQMSLPNEEIPQEMLQSVMASIDDLSRKQNQSLTTMKANFDTAYQKGVELRNSLLEQQAKLNATMAHERNLENRLHQAADHLMKTQNELSHKLGALRTFHERLGGKSNQDAISLLQIRREILCSDCPERHVCVRDGGFCGAQNSTADGQFTCYASGAYGEMCTYDCVWGNCPEGTVAAGTSSNCKRCDPE